MSKLLKEAFGWFTNPLLSEELLVPSESSWSDSRLLLIHLLLRLRGLSVLLLVVFGLSGAGFNRAARGLVVDAAGGLVVISDVRRLLGGRLSVGKTDRGGVVLKALGLFDLNLVRKRDLRALQSGRVVRSHDFHLDTEDTLSKANVLLSNVNVVVLGVTRRNHIPLLELHGFGTLPSQFSRHNDFTTLGLGLHNESECSVARSSNGTSFHELVLDGLSLGEGAKSSVVDTLSEKLNLWALLEPKSVLDLLGELVNTLSLVSHDWLGSGGSNDDFDLLGRSSDFNPGVTDRKTGFARVVLKFRIEKVVQLGEEDSVLNLASLKALV